MGPPAETLSRKCPQTGGSAQGQRPWLQVPGMQVVAGRGALTQSVASDGPQEVPRRAVPLGLQVEPLSEDQEQPWEDHIPQAQDGRAAPRAQQAGGQQHQGQGLPACAPPARHLQGSHRRQRGSEQGVKGVRGRARAQAAGVKGVLGLGIAAPGPEAQRCGGKADSGLTSTMTLSPLKNRGEMKTQKMSYRNASTSSTVDTCQAAPRARDRALGNGSRALQGQCRSATP